MNLAIKIFSMTLIFSTSLASQEYKSHRQGVPDEEIFRKGLFIVPNIEIYNPILGQYAISTDLADKLMLFSFKELPTDTCLSFHTEVIKAPRNYAKIYALAMKTGTVTTIQIQGDNLEHIALGLHLCMICKEIDGSITLEPIKGRLGNGEEFSINVFEHLVGGLEAYSIIFNSNNYH